MNEIWKALPGFLGVEVSTLGNVRTLDKLVSSEEYTRFIKGHVLKQCNDKDGYLMVHIPIDGKSITKKVHRLVAETFIANHNGLPMVNHKDCNRKNNNVDNLEFCTASYNNHYREKFGNAKGLPVLAVNLATLEVHRFPSQMEAGRVLGFGQGHISAVIKGKRKQSNGFWFTNADDNANDIINRKLHEIGKAGLTASATNKLGAE